jgi:hypothetical protein
MQNGSTEAVLAVVLRLHDHMVMGGQIQAMQLGLYYGFAMTIFYTCFCRQARMNKRNTRRDIRWVFTMLGVVSIIVLLAPFYGHEADPIEVLLLGAFACVQVATAYHWRAGVPVQFAEIPPDDAIPQR